MSYVEINLSIRRRHADLISAIFDELLALGALDADTFDIATTALETLHGQGRKVGVITHVAAMIESIPVQVKVEKQVGVARSSA